MKWHSKGIIELKNINLADHMQTPVAVIDKNMIIVDANPAFVKRSQKNSSNVVGMKCFEAAYHFNSPCDQHNTASCPLVKAFETKKTHTRLHHFWNEDHAVVEEITTTPIIEKNGAVNYVVEEYRDIAKLLGLNKGIISVCSYCKKIHDNEQWVIFESYLQKHTGASFSHGICEACSEELFEEYKVSPSGSH